MVLAAGLLVWSLNAPSESGYPAKGVSVLAGGFPCLGPELGHTEWAVHIVPSPGMFFLNTCFIGCPLKRDGETRPRNIHDDDVPNDMEFKVGGVKALIE